MKKRLIEDAEQRLFEDLKWTGLQWDEGIEYSLYLNSRLTYYQVRILEDLSDLIDK